MTTTRPGVVLGVLLLLLGLVAGCTGSDAPGDTSGEAEATTAEPLSYAALGDSFTAAPYVPETDFAEGCLRSSGSYPALLADELGARLRDVSCSGADTDDLRKRDRDRGLPAQLEAVRPGTDLVTVGIGGNDEDLFGRLVGSCTSGSPCVAELRAALGSTAAAIRRVGDRVAEVLRLVRRTAPEATVVLVGYPRLVDPRLSCRELPLAASDRPVIASWERRLNRALHRAARSVGAEYVDVYSASRGHEICSSDPWVNGRRTDEQRALAFHPFAVGQRAVADLLLDLVAPAGR